MFGLLAAEAADDDVRDGLAWAREAGLPEGEARAMEAWVTARSGTAPEPASVPAGGAGSR